LQRITFRSIVNLSGRPMSALVPLPDSIRTPQQVRKVPTSEVLRTA
jgi:hypothetical protein